MSMTNCVNCGSAKESNLKVCPFCGTSYFDFTDIDLGERQQPCIVRFKYHDNVFQMKAFVGLAEFTITPQTVDVASFDSVTPKHLLVHNDVRASIEFVGAD